MPPFLNCNLTDAMLDEKLISLPKNSCFAIPVLILQALKVSLIYLHHQLLLMAIKTFKSEIAF